MFYTLIFFLTHNTCKERCDRFVCFQWPLTCLIYLLAYTFMNSRCGMMAFFDINRTEYDQHMNIKKIYCVGKKIHMRFLALLLFFYSSILFLIKAMVFACIVAKKQKTKHYNAFSIKTHIKK